MPDDPLLPAENQPILDIEYWKNRLIEAPKDQLYKSIFQCPPGVWADIEKQHTAIINQHVGEFDSVLDVGCGYGRLRKLLSKDWKGEYMGIDHSPDFIELARKNFPRRNNPSRKFACCDIRSIRGWELEKKYDWAIVLSVRHMIIGYLGNDFWLEVEAGIKHVAHRALYLEYVDGALGVVE